MKPSSKTPIRSSNFAYRYQLCAIDKVQFAQQQQKKIEKYVFSLNFLQFIIYLFIYFYYHWIRYQTTIVLANLPFFVKTFFSEKPL